MAGFDRFGVVRSLDHGSVWLFVRLAGPVSAYSGSLADRNPVLERDAPQPRAELHASVSAAQLGARLSVVPAPVASLNPPSWVAAVLWVDVAYSLSSIGWAVCFLAVRAFALDFRPDLSAAAAASAIVAAVPTLVADVWLLKGRRRAATLAGIALVLSSAGQVFQCFAGTRWLQMFVPSEVLTIAMALMVGFALLRLAWTALYLFSCLRLLLPPTAPPMRPLPGIAQAVTAQYDAFLSYSHRQDSRAAATLQRALQRFARPVMRARRIRVFRDDDSLPMNPDLWGSLVKVLDRCSCLILLASPASARSEWVQREVTHFVRQRGTEKLGIVLTDGVAPWTEGPSASESNNCAISAEVLRLFQDKPPLVVDFRPYRLANGGLRTSGNDFADCLASIVATVWSTTKDEVYGEHLRRQRQHAFFLSALAAVLTISLLVAVRQSFEASRRTEEVRAEVRRATGYRLAERARALGPRDPGLAVLLGAEAILTPRRWGLSESSTAWAALQFVTDMAGNSRRLVAHGGPVRRMAISKARQLFTAGDDQRVYRWDLNATTPRSQLVMAGVEPADMGAIAPESSSWIYDLVFSANEKWVARLGREGGIRGCAVDGGKPFEVAAPGSIYAAYVFSGPGADEMAVLSRAGILSVYSLESSSRRSSLDLELHVHDAILQEGALLVAGSQREGLHGMHVLVRIDPREMRTEARMFPEPPGAKRPSKVKLVDSDTIGILTDGMLKLRELGAQSGEPVLVANAVSDFWSLIQGEWLLLLRPAELQLWRRAGDRWVDTHIGASLTARFSEDEELAIASSADGSTIAAGTPDGTVVLLPTSPLRPVRRYSLHAGPISTLAFVDTRLVSSSLDGITSVTDLGTVTEANAPSEREHGRLLDPSPAALNLIVSSDRSTLAVLETVGPDATSLRIISGEEPSQPRPIRLVSRFSGPYALAAEGDDRQLELVHLWNQALHIQSMGVKHVQQAAVTPNGRWVAYAGDGCLKLRDRRNPVSDRTLGESASTGELTLSSDGSWLATAGYNGELIPVAAPLERIRTAPLDGNSTITTQFSLDNRWFAASTSRGMVKLWQLTSRTTATEVARIKFPEQTWAHHLAFDADSSRLVIGGDDGVIRVVNPMAFDIAGSVRLLRGHHGAITSLDISPAGQLLSASTDGSVQVWSVVGGDQSLMINESEDPVLAARFLSSSYVSADRSGIRAWRSPSRPALLQLACSVAGRNLSVDEWERYLPDLPMEATCPTLPAGAARRRPWTWTHD
jgi:WD40 repeat protein